MRGESIICFAKDWEEAPTSNHHVMRELARDHDVVWLNSVSTRTPSLNGRDLRKIVRKLRQFFRGPQRVDDGMWVFTPLVLPLPHSPMAKTLNRRLLQFTIWWLQQRLDIERFQLWTFLPSTADYVGALGESLVVYYVVDEWSLFSYVDGARIAEADRELCKRADVVFAVCGTLAASRRVLNPTTHLAPHGVDYELFRRAIEPGPIPHDIAMLGTPLIGFYGTVQDWVDQRLLAYLAARHPEWNIVLIGPRLCDTSALEAFPNIHLLGARDHARLPDYCRAFSVGLIPYVVEERMRYVNPLKLREYLSAGLPIVSTEVPEAERFAPHCTVAKDYAAFEAAVEEALRHDSPTLRRERSESMKSETWSARVAEVCQHVAEAAREKERCQRQFAIA
ncbi:MAG TPA: glycosyltransferase [Polyangiaceae bacterium]|nr:glycosyltransferase [Polyangiaceae bacterium]